MGYLPENPAFYNDMSVLSNICFISRLHGYTRKESLTRGREVLTDFIKKLKTEDGFRNSLEDTNITLESTYYGIVISDFLQTEYSIYDIIYIMPSNARDKLRVSTILSSIMEAFQK